MSIAAVRVEVWNSSYVPLASTRLPRALQLVRDKRAVIEEFHTDGRRIRMVGGIEVPFPKVIRLLAFLSIGTEYVEKTFSKQGVLERDNYTCGYCLGPATTHDHIHPRSRGGKDTWKNAISACISCNGLKGNRTPEEADMPLLLKPMVPYEVVFRSNKPKRPKKKR